MEQIRFDFSKSQFQNELKSLRMSFSSDFENWIEGAAQYDTRLKWATIGRTADHMPKSTISFRHVSIIASSIRKFHPEYRTGKLKTPKVNWMESEFLVVIIIIALTVSKPYQNRTFSI